MGTTDLRNTWSFKYANGALLEAARMKYAHHQDRLAFWEKKHAETKDKLMKEGIEITGSVSNLLSNSYRGEQVKVDSRLLEDHQECQQKVTEHRDSAKGYDSWIQVLSVQPAGEVQHLTIGDYLFFYGK